jgi:hypothetical protein
VGFGTHRESKISGWIALAEINQLFQTGKFRGMNLREPWRV